MKCWCDEINYKCSVCETSETWSKLKAKDKIKLMAYKKILLAGLNQHNKSHWELNNYIVKNNLCVTMVPDLELNHGKGSI